MGLQQQQRQRNNMNSRIKTQNNIHTQTTTVRQQNKDDEEQNKSGLKSKQTKTERISKGARVQYDAELGLYHDQGLAVFLLIIPHQHFRHNLHIK